MFREMIVKIAYYGLMTVAFSSILFGNLFLLFLLYYLKNMYWFGYIGICLVIIAFFFFEIILLSDIDIKDLKFPDYLKNDKEKK